MLGCKVNVGLHVFVVGGMLAVGLGLDVVGLTQLHRGKLVGVGPSALAGNHLPPDAYILHGLDPGGIIIGARVVEVEGHLGSQDVAGIVAHDDRTPGRLARSLQIALPALCIGREPRLEHQVLVVEVEVHAAVVHQCCLVQVDVEAIGGLQLEGGLHAGRREGSLRGVGRDGTLHQTADFGQLGLGVVVLLRVVVAGNPEGGVVAGHSKLSMFLLDNEVVELLLQGELIAESESVVEDAEADEYLAALGRLVESDSQFVVVVADFGHFAPYRAPRLVETAFLHFTHAETIHQSGIVLQLQTQRRGPQHALAFVEEFVDGGTLGSDRYIQHHFSIGRGGTLGIGQHRVLSLKLHRSYDGQQQQGQSGINLSHILKWV